MAKRDRRMVPHNRSAQNADLQCTISREQLISTRTNAVSARFSFLLRQEVGHRQVSLTGVVVEGEDSRPISKFGELLGNARERSTGRNSDQQAFLARGSTRHFLRFIGVD